MYNNYIYNCYAYGCRCRQGCASARASVRSGGRSRGDGVGETRAVPRTLLHSNIRITPYVSRTRYANAYDSHDARTPPATAQASRHRPQCLPVDPRSVKAQASARTEIGWIDARWRPCTSLEIELRCGVENRT